MERAAGFSSTGQAQLMAQAAAALRAAELRDAEDSSADEAVQVLFKFLGWSSGGLGAAAIETVQRAEAAEAAVAKAREGALTFDEFRDANVTRCLKWHPAGITSWSPSDWLTAVTGELGELASLLKMRNRERDGLPGNKFSPTDKQVADELADVLTYLDLLAAVLNVDLGRAAVDKFNEVSERVGFPDRIRALCSRTPQA